MDYNLQTLYLKEEEFSHLREIVKTLSGVEIKDNKNRMQHIVDSKMIYANILHEKGYGCSVIARYMGMNHATILHYFKKFPWYLKTDVPLKNKYERIKSEFNKEYDPVYYLSENELKKEVFSLRIENELLSSELEKLTSDLSVFHKREGRLQNIYKVIEERTRIGSEDKILNKLIRFYNGVYDK